MAAEDDALAAEAQRTLARLQESAEWLVSWMREPEPEMRLREGGTVEDAFELIKGLADLATLLATQLGAAAKPPLGAVDVVQDLAGATRILTDDS